jgi:hypothetical protein
MGRPRGTQVANSQPKSNPEGIPGGGLTLNSAFYWEFANRVRALVEQMPPRTTARQAYAFLLIVRENSMGRSVTAKGLRDLAGRDGNFDEILGQSIQRTYQIFLEADERNPEGLGWIYVEMDKEDRRQNFLKLTQKGLKVASTIRLFP